MSPISSASTRRKSSRWNSRSILRWPSSLMSVPDESKNRTMTRDGSSWCSRTVSPAKARGDRVRNRVTGTLATSRSSTSTPDALSPAMMARLSMRAARLESREITTVVPFFNDVPWAIASLTASSGVTSTLAKPVTPSRPNRLREPLLSQTMLVFTTAPSSMVLNGYTLTSPLSTAPLPTNTESPSTTPSSIRTFERMLQLRPTTAPRRRTPDPT